MAELLPKGRQDGLRQIGQRKGIPEMESSPGLSFRRERKRVELSRFQKILVFVLEMAVVVALAYGIVWSFGVGVRMEGGSMEPSLSSGDSVMIDRFSYTFRKPKPNDVIAYKTEDGSEESYSIKRIVGVPGQTVEVRSGNIYVDGEAFSEIADVKAIDDAGLLAKGVTLPKDEYLVLGDNRNNSQDSRYASVGNIHKDRIRGKAWLSIRDGKVNLVD